MVAWKSIPHYPQYIPGRTVGLLNTLEEVFPLGPLDPEPPKDCQLMSWIRTAQETGILTAQELYQAQSDIGPHM
jgi:hypothetical protein